MVDVCLLTTSPSFSTQSTTVETPQSPHDASNMTGRSHLGNFLLTRTEAKSVRQRHHTGPQMNKRKFFNFGGGNGANYHKLHKRDAVGGEPTFDRRTFENDSDKPWARYQYLPGDARRKPDYDLRLTGGGAMAPENNGRSSFSEPRQDDVVAAWKKRGNLQLYLFSAQGKRDVFVCFRCGYPVSSKMQAIKCDNWDWRMCYSCYVQTINRGEQDTI